MDKYPKFIIEDGCLILMKVTYHKEIATNKDNVRGGGWFFFTSTTNTFTFSGDSTDFGKASMDDVKSAIDNGKVFTNPSQTHNISDKHNFAYNTGSEIIMLKELNEGK